MNKLTKFIPVGLLLLPITAFAQGRIVFLMADLRFIINTLTIVVAGVALLVFFWGLAMFIFKVGGDETAVKEGKTLMIWGIIALFVMVSIWGIIRFAQVELFRGIDFTTSPVIPSFRP